MSQLPISTNPTSAMESKRAPEGLTLLGIILGLGFLILSCFWTLQSEIYNHAVQLGESVPVVPAMTALLLLTVAALILRRSGLKTRLTQGQILFVYCFLGVAVTMNSVGVCRYMFPSATVPFYFAAPENNYSLVQKYIPTWLVPQDRAAIQNMYEGSENEKVPWGPWIVPLASWTLLLLLFFLTMMGTVAIFRRQWSDKERLTFPIVQMVLDVSDQEGKRVLGGFFGNPLMWVGFGLAALYNISNILNAWNPAVPAMGTSYDIGRFFTERPLSGLRPISLTYRPENLGLGFLVPTEITLSVWVFYLAQRVANFMMTTAGVEISGFPFEREQSVGAYLALAFFFIWVSRDYLKTVFLKAWKGSAEIDDSREPMSYRTAFICAIGGYIGLIIFSVKAGMWWWTAAIFFGLLVLFALVYARARAEAGAAMVWLFPFQMHKLMMIHVAGSAPYSAGGNWGNLTLLTMFTFLSRGFFQSNIAYVLEGTKIAQEARLNQRTMTKVLVGALLLGLVAAYATHLHAYYSVGANVLEGGTSDGGYRVVGVRQEFDELSGFINSQRLPDKNRSLAGLAGAVVVALLIVVRTYSLRFPLHPLGYAMVTSYGGPIWGPFLVAWLTKTIILRIGGMGAYRRMIPLFMGIVIGHFFTAGVVWGSVSMINEMYRRYAVHFG